MKYHDWHFDCDTAVFDRIKKEESFQQILALARAVNSLQFVVSAFALDRDDFSPRASRSRINSFLFGSAILYEAFLLVEQMNQQFGRNETFSEGLHELLKDPTALTLRTFHMRPARNFAVFHYDHDAFGEVARRAKPVEEKFMTGLGNTSLNSYYPYADRVAAEVLVGEFASDDDFYERLGRLMLETRELSLKFVRNAEKLITRCLLEWGFVRHILTDNSDAAETQAGGADYAKE